MRLIQKLKLLLGIILVVILLSLVAWWMKNDDWTNLHKRIGYRGGRTPLVPTVLWWTQFVPGYHETRRCGFNECTFTVDRRLLNDNNTRIVAFYGSDMNKTDLPLPRLPHHLWALYHEESPKNVPYIQHNSVLKYFNVTATFSRYSNFPLTTQYLASQLNLTERKYLVAIGTKSMLRKELAPVAFVQSICDTLSGRDEYVKEMMQYIDVDSYGQCLHNRDLPEELRGDYLNTIQSDAFYKFFARYKFIISYENGVCNDYISEKFWRPLVMGNIPIYFGSPTIKDWEPTNKSVIHISDFPNPKALAKFLKRLDENDYEYNTYLDHKYSFKHAITNKLLMDTLLERDFDSDNYLQLFECYLCNRAHEEGFRSTANGKHYDCGDRLQFPPMSTSMQNSDWHSIMAIGKCQADILDTLLQRNANFTEQEFDDMLQQNIKTRKCRL